MTLTSMLFLTGIFACSESDKDAAESTDTGASPTAEDSGTPSDSGSPQDSGAAEEDSGTDDELGTCESDYGFCGSIEIPSPLEGTPRAMAISLYDTLTPAGPPNVTVTEIDAPAVVAGEPYEIEFSPLIATGEYYVWVFLYMEGGGEWAPVSGVDYVGHTAELVTFDREAVNFPSIVLEMAE